MNCLLAQKPWKNQKKSPNKLRILNCFISHQQQFVVGILQFSCKSSINSLFSTKLCHFPPYVMYTQVPTYVVQVVSGSLFHFWIYTYSSSSISSSAYSQALVWVPKLPMAAVLVVHVQWMRFQSWIFQQNQVTKMNRIMMLVSLPKLQKYFNQVQFNVPS